MRKLSSMPVAVLVILMLILTACTGGGDESPGESTAATSQEPATSEPAEESVAPEESEAPTGFAACGDQDSGDAFKVGGVTDVGDLEDKSFNEAGWCGTLAGTEAIGGSAEVIVTADPADYAANMQRLIDDGYDIIVTYGFALGDATAIAAKENPDIQFIGLDQAVCLTPEGDPDGTFACEGDPLPNYQGLIFAEAQAGYLAGVVAGSITESNVIGTIGGIFDIPPVPQYMGGFHNGALSVNPDVEVLSEFVSDDITKAFNDPGTGRTIAEQMMDLGADVIFQVAGGSGQGALEAACDQDVYGIGVDVDQYFSLPEPIRPCLVTSAEKKIVKAIQGAIERVADGSAEGGTILGNAANGGIGLAPYHELEDLITPEIQAAVDAALAALASGDLDPCAGPGICFFDPDE